MQQGKGSNQERKYLTFQCGNIVFMILNNLLCSSVESINFKSEVRLPYLRVYGLKCFIFLNVLPGFNVLLSNLQCLVHFILTIGHYY